MRRAAPLLIVVAAQVAALVMLHRLGGSPGYSIPVNDLGAWLRVTSPVDAALATARLAALAATWWLLGSTLLYAGARFFHASRGLRLARRLVLPGLRHLIDRALVASAVAATVLGSSIPGYAEGPRDSDPGTTEGSRVAVRTGRAGDPAAAPSATTSPGEQSRDGQSPDSQSPPEQPSPAPRASPPGSTPAAAPGGTLPTARFGAHVVRPGEHLWSIAAAYLAEATGREVTTLPAGDIARFWVRLCDLNQARLASGDLDLIYPGEVIDLPEP